VGAPPYRREEKALLLAAVKRYGPTPAARMLAEAGHRVPALYTLSRWVSSGDVAITQDATDALDQYEREAHVRWRASMDARRQATFDAYDQAVADRNYLGMQQASKAIGIQYDRQVPPVRSGTSPVVGDAGTVQIILVAPAERATRLSLPTGLSAG
jgi:hypothetical protein